MVEWWRITELFDKGGIVMMLILALSVYMAAIIIYKARQFWKLQLHKTSFIDQAFTYLAKHDVKGAVAAVALHKHPVARVMESALVLSVRRDRSFDRIQEEVERVGNHELRYLESHMRGLEMTANVAPLLGLLGTVIGMVVAFSTLEQAGSRVNPALLAGGIWTALLTTVVGLSVAIPALGAHYFFDSRIEAVRGQMADITTRILGQYEKLGSMVPAAASPAGNVPNPAAKPQTPQPRAMQPLVQ